MEKSIMLGEKEYTYKINFKLSYDFLKFRNRISNGFDFSSADKEVVKEIAEMQEKMEKASAKGKELSDFDFLKELSPKALDFLQKNQKTNSDLFNYDEIIEIVMKLTKETDEEIVNEILDEEIGKNGYDALIEKLVKAVAEVFTSAKDNSQQKAINKAELIEVAKK